MSTPPPGESHKPAVGWRLPREEIDKLVVAVDDAINEGIAPTRHRDDSPLPAFGPTPPVPQPGRPPMSQRATDVSGVLLAGGLASIPVGGMTSLVVYTVGQANPVSLTIAGCIPVAAALAVGSLVRAIGRTRADAHTEHHHHYNAPVHQDMRSSSTRGVWARTNNNP